MPTILLGLTAAVLIGYAGYAVFDGSDGQDGSAGQDADEQSARANTGQSRRADKKRVFRPMFKSRTKVQPEYEAREHEQVIQPTAPTVGEISPEDALAAFNASLDAMDEAMEEGRTSRKRKRELYAQTTNAFTALSGHLDARDPEQRIVLEEAHFEMKQRMKALKMRVPKRAGTVLD
jgi:hypothetical protein